MSMVLHRSGLLLAVGVLGAMAAAEPPPPATPATSQAAPAQASQPAAQPGHDRPRVVLEIQHARKNLGQIVVELDPAKAPQTVKNFLTYVDEGFYNGIIFHRVLPDYLAQAGGYVSHSQPKTAGLHPPIPNEAQNELKNLRGTIAVARKWKQPDSATSEFFINVKDNPGLDPRHPDGDGFGYCVFGKVVEGMEIVDRIVNIATRLNPRMPRENSLPVAPPTITRAYRFGTNPPPLPSQPTADSPADGESMPVPLPGLELPAPATPAPVTPTPPPATRPAPPPLPPATQHTPTRPPG